MSLPALRQPKNIDVEEKNQKNKEHQTTATSYCEPQNYLIVTLKDGKKLVVSSDAYNGIFTAGELYRCVFCETEMIRDVTCKERHKSSQNHRKILESYPHVEEFKENLIRKVCIIILSLSCPTIGQASLPSIHCSWSIAI